MSAQQFLDAYAALCREHGLVITACSCCDYEWLQSLEESRFRGVTLEEKVQDAVAHLSGSLFYLSEDE